MSATLDDYRWLVSEAAEPWLAIASEESDRGGSVALVSRLRRELSAERAHLVVEQAELRRRARDKFALAGKMFFTRKGLEQATDEQIAAYKAGRFPAGDRIVDLCCGIGGDLISLASRGPANGVDRDPVLGRLAEANAQSHRLHEPQCAVLVDDAAQFPLNGANWHCDPDRRAIGRRATRGELFEPPLATIAGLLQRSRNAAIKLAPATKVPEAWRQQAELEWIASRGECRQQVAWFGSLAKHPSRHAATVISRKGRPRTVVGLSDEAIPNARQVGQYVYEPDAAVLAARLVATLCLPHALAAISPEIAYLTSDALIDEPALDAFQVIDVLPLDRKQLRAYCGEHRLGRLEIKKRGVQIDPEQLRKEIVGDGDDEATILIAPIGGQVRAIVARRITSETSPD